MFLIDFIIFFMCEKVDYKSLVQKYICGLIWNNFFAWKPSHYQPTFYK